MPDNFELRVWRQTARLGQAAEGGNDGAPPMLPLPAAQTAPLTAPERTLRIRRAASRFCALSGWAPVEEMPLPNGRRADLVALLPGGDFAIIEVKSGPRDFLADAKWPEYRDYADRLYFAVDLEFPVALLPADAGLILAAPPEAALHREAPLHRLSPARRRALLLRFATLAAGRLAALSDPSGAAEMRAALRLD
jgi:hypothetical protein